MATYTLIAYDPLIANNPAAWPPGTEMQGTTFSLNEGDVLNVESSSINPSALLPTIINAGTGNHPVNFDININQDLPYGQNEDLYQFSFGGNSSPTVNVADGVDASALIINATSASGLDLSTGENTELGTIHTGNGNDGAVNNIDIGNGSKIRGIQGAGGGDENITFGENVSVTTNIVAGGKNASLTAGDGLSVGGGITLQGTEINDIQLGDQASISGSVVALSGDTSFTAGDSLNITGALSIAPGAGNSADIVLGNDAKALWILTSGENDSLTASDGLTVTSNIHLASSESSTINIGNDATIPGFIAGGLGENNYVIGDNLTATWVLAYDYDSVTPPPPATEPVDPGSVDPDARGGSIIIGSGANVSVVSTFVANPGAETLISIGPNSSISGYVQGGLGKDVISIGTDSTVSGYIYSYSGADQLTSEGYTPFTYNYGSGGVNVVKLIKPVDSNNLQMHWGDLDLQMDGDILQVNLLHEQRPGFIAVAQNNGWSYDSENDVLSGGNPFSYNNMHIGYWDRIDFICFAGGTYIKTMDGDKRIDSISVGDLVETLDHGFQPVRWLGSRKLGAGELEAMPHLRPIRIAAGALGTGVPDRDLLVSPQHRVLVRSRIAQKMFGTAEVLVAAKQLVLLDGIDIATDLVEVEYFHILFDRHEVVISNGAETESLYTGPEALKSVGKAAAEEIFALFPDLADPTHVSQPARYLASGRQARKMGIRHLQNNRPLVAEN
ncbi:Hint domain-containing protein [Paracoccus sp. J55]|uniref:Hint domain-containing protein n=1 Tax=Paracoccus sp. J55 TaxID=935849 RepID=UPI0004AF37FD|nr:Hint domain-containing protein [Paracoccus sp. J55]